MAKRTPDIGEIPPPSREARLKVAKLRKLSLQFLTTPNKMRRPSLLRATTSDSEGPSQRQIWLFRLAKFLLVLTFVEDGLRMIIHPEGQARVALGLPSVGPSRAAGEAREDYLPAVKAAAFVGGILQTWLAVFVVLATDPRLAASAMAVLAIVNIAVFTNPLVRRTAHVHGIAAYLCRSGASIAGLLALVAHADAEHSQASSALDDPYVRAKKRGEKVQLVSRILVAFYFLFSGGVLCPSGRPRWRGGNAIDRLRRRLRVVEHVGLRRRHRRRRVGGVGLQIYLRRGPPIDPRRHARHRFLRRKTWGTQAPPRRPHVRRRAGPFGPRRAAAPRGHRPGRSIRRRQVRERQLR